MGCFSNATKQKMKFSAAVNVKETAFWSHLLKKCLMENFILSTVCAVLQISNEHRKILLRPSTAQDSNIHAVLKTAEKRYS